MTDILLDDDLDLQIVNNDFVIGDATEQNQKLIISANKGEVRPYAFVGVGIAQAVHDDNVGSLKQEIIKQFELDGMTLNRLNIKSSGTMEIDATYG
ncbi:hypothetical protein [Roseivirga sp. UBA1976]|uniref:hypothetical protein n=1 Tax=Roseivirga sp. UBA1976 TaxID=1947386 RepID=UPI00257D2EE3|nr:hypothetical protein [Roseivirga sp. UBA1976]|tara:strand:+ start:7141 stop:7428 length:288 start_codon:yes stop_codon:yes gene_type:complete